MGESRGAGGILWHIFVACCGEEINDDNDDDLI